MAEPKNTMGTRILRVVLSRTFALVFLAFLQIAFFCGLGFWFANIGIGAYLAFTVLTVLAVVAILEKDELNPAYKLMWVLCIFLLPIFGTLFYVLWGRRQIPLGHRAKLQEVKQRTEEVMKQEPAVLQALQKAQPALGQSAQYLLNCAASPVYNAHESQYYPLGKHFFPAFIDAIKNAKEYIFMEYYIFESGDMLKKTVDILGQKAAQGVDVRLVWDGIGSLFTLPPGFEEELKSKGIKFSPFCPVAFTLSLSDYAMLNHRDHRKITVVDGEIGFTGGINFADEYINAKERFGVWKDTTVKITGPAVFSLTTTFLRAWDYSANQVTNLLSYAKKWQNPTISSLENGFVQPFWDSPLDDESVCENAYLNVIRNARKYVYISTPYLILDHEMIVMLTLAAKSGVDVRILTPGIPDKRPVYWVTQSYYPVLLKGGVRIFEYSPGFNHAKMYVSDDDQAIIGSANMDYRSLFLHFENCISFYGGSMPNKVKKDMLACFDASHEVTLLETQQTKPLRRLLQMGAKFFAPVL